MPDLSIPGYDAWKLATPPEYEMTAKEEECQRARNNPCPRCGGDSDDPVGTTDAILCGECWDELHQHDTPSDHRVGED